MVVLFSNFKSFVAGFGVVCCLQIAELALWVLVMFVVLQIADSSLTVGFMVVVFVVCNVRSCFTVGFVVVVFVLLQSAEACFVGFGGTAICGSNFANCRSWCFGGFVVTAGVCLLQTIITTILQKS